MFREDPDLSHVKWVLPHSPTRKVTANLKMEMPSWFDIYSFGLNTSEDENGMLESAGLISEVIQKEVDGGIDPSHIVLGGFSQGACMSLLTGLTREWKLAGVVALSGWLPLRHKFKSMASEHASSTPVFFATGNVDPLVNYEVSRTSVNLLRDEIGIKSATGDEFGGLTFKTYEGMGHSTTQTELDDVKAWIKKAIPKEI